MMNGVLIRIPGSGMRASRLMEAPPVHIYISTLTPLLAQSGWWLSLQTLHLATLSNSVPGPNGIGFTRVGWLHITLLMHAAELDPCGRHSAPAVSVVCIKLIIGTTRTPHVDTWWSLPPQLKTIKTCHNERIMDPRCGDGDSFSDFLMLGGWRVWMRMRTEETPTMLI